MGLFSNFVDRVMNRKIEDLTARANIAGQAAVDKAHELVPVRTGRLYRSIGYTWSQATMTLSLFADEPYSFWVERRKAFLRPAREVMRRMFMGATADIQFPTLPEKYHGRAKLMTKGSKGTIIGHRVWHKR